MIGKHLEIILKEMCKRVGADYKVSNSHRNWFTDYEWTEKEQDDFVDWLTNYFDNKEARQELLNYPAIKTKKRLKESAKEFVFNYGWKLKGDLK